MKKQQSSPHENFPHHHFFELSSHQRAKKAIDFALKMRPSHYHILLMGDKKTGRIYSTLSYLQEYVKKQPAPHDWIYLKNFHRENAPLPFALPAGKGIMFEADLRDFIHNVKTVVGRVGRSTAYIKTVEDIATQVQFNIDMDFKNLSDLAQEKGFKLVQTQDDITIEPMEDFDQFSENDLKPLRQILAKISQNANIATQRANKKIHALKRKTIKESIYPLWKDFRKHYVKYMGHWLDHLLHDMIEHIDLFLDVPDASGSDPEDIIKERYAVNLFVDNRNQKHPVVHLQDTSNFESLFGSIEYTNHPHHGLTTNFTMMKAGSLHKANGGYLIIRADDILKNY
ncbi:MAG: AAA family ATPase, partial [Alphaproteobacteria bacterium]|nr:AAA family ATPase [Alphaproteobacteria bacterium]